MIARPLLIALVLALGMQDDTTSDAAAAFEKAEARARAGRYDDARNEYKRIVSKYPGTPEAVEAELRSRPSAFLGWADVVRNGPSKNRIDVVLMGDGYELNHMGSFDKLSEDIPPLFARQSTFREYYSYFNFIRAALVSADSGVDGFGREYDTALNGHTLNTFAGHVGIDRSLVLNVMSRIPDTDGLAIVFVKNGVLGTGGGGIATIGGREVKTIIHEFGHSFGGLSDEYETQQSHGQGAARDGINVAATDDPKSVPWAHWIAAKHPGVGVVEGALGRVKGAWRPTSTGCVMSSTEGFCVVCQEALVLRIYSVVDPIESVTPAPQAQRVREPYTIGDDPFEIVVNVMQPATHSLEVTWWILPEARIPESGGASSRYGDTGTAGPRDRRRREKLVEITDKPASNSQNNTSGVHKLVLKKNELEPGRYRIICRVKDTTKLRGEKWPWVLKDDLGLLESERGWWVEVAKAP
ncbi:MAG: hypothetical protein JNL28_16380 [Planctomycetes bacterium]|nr:hypothetical protein [Planctomycetota bacterium]